MPLYPYFVPSSLCQKGRNQGQDKLNKIMHLGSFFAFFPLFPHPSGGAGASAGGGAHGRKEGNKGKNRDSYI